MVFFVVSGNEATETGTDHHHHNQHHRHRHVSYNYNYSHCPSNKVSTFVTSFKEYLTSLKLIGGVSTFYKRHKIGETKRASETRDIKVLSGHFYTKDKS